MTRKFNINEIFNLKQEGLSNMEIADKLAIKESSVRFIIKNRGGNNNDKQ